MDATGPGRRARLARVTPGPGRPAGAARAAGSLAAVLLLAAGAGTSPAAAWSPRTHVRIAELAASISPPDLRRQIVRHERDYLRGLEARFSAEGRHGDRPEEMRDAVLGETERAIQAIRGHRPFSEIVFRLGLLTRAVALLNDPATAIAGAPGGTSYAADYRRYVESAQGRFKVVFYGDGRGLDGPETLSALVGRSLERSRRFSPALRDEYTRIGRIEGVKLFDDRSTAFGVGAVAFSHAVSDVAAVLRYVWIEAGGADGRDLGLSRPGS